MASVIFSGGEMRLIIKGDYSVLFATLMKMK